jgi:hypothetical protein
VSDRAAPEASAAPRVREGPLRACRHNPFIWLAVLPVIPAFSLILVNAECPPLH